MSKSRAKRKPKPTASVVQSKARRALKDAQETKRFLTILVITTILLVVLLYIIFVR